MSNWKTRPLQLLHKLLTSEKLHVLVVVLCCLPSIFLTIYIGVSKAPTVVSHSDSPYNSTQFFKIAKSDSVMTPRELETYIKKSEAECKNTLEIQKKPTSVYCRGDFDMLLCWPHSRPGQVELGCPQLMFDNAQPHQKAVRLCLDSGNWMESNEKTWVSYDDCFKNEENVQIEKQKIEEVPDLEGKDSSEFSSFIHLYTTGYSFSIAGLVISLFILLHFRALHCTRNYIHCHLFSSFILRAVLVFLKDSIHLRGMDEELEFDGSTLRAKSYEYGNFGQEVGCKIVSALYHYAFCTNYMWVLIEGLYLHNLMFVAVFSDKQFLWKYQVIGWGVPVIFIVPWALLRWTKSNTRCWKVLQSDIIIEFVHEAPLLVAMSFNLILFVNMIRFLYKKIKPVKPRVQGQQTTHLPQNHYKKLLKSTLMCMPMFGVHQIFFVVAPASQTFSTKWKARMYWDLFFNSFQGFFLSVVYCLSNAEVKHELKRAWQTLSTDLELTKAARRRSRASITTLTAFNSSASHGPRLSLGSIISSNTQRTCSIDMTNAKTLCNHQSLNSFDKNPENMELLPMTHKSKNDSLVSVNTPCQSLEQLARFMNSKQQLLLFKSQSQGTDETKQLPSCIRRNQNSTILKDDVRVALKECYEVNDEIFDDEINQQIECIEMTEISSTVENTFSFETEKLKTNCSVEDWNEENSDEIEKSENEFYKSL